jgi:hypothetical protein
VPAPTAAVIVTATIDVTVDAIERRRDPFIPTVFEESLGSGARPLNTSVLQVLVLRSVGALLSRRLSRGSNKAKREEFRLQRDLLGTWRVRAWPVNS